MRFLGAYATIALLLCPLPLLAQANGYAPDDRAPGVTVEGDTVRLEPARELLAIFVSRSDCEGNSLEGLDEAVRDMKDALDARADSLGYSFDAIGVALDDDIPTGLRYLREGESSYGTMDFGPWAEISVGRGFLGMASSYLLLEEGDRAVPVPQVIVVERTVIPQMLYAEVTRPRRVLRLQDGRKIVEWAERGFPLENLTEDPLESTRNLR